VWTFPFYGFSIEEFDMHIPPKHDL
jgi:hypothetical protein